MLRQKCSNRKNIETRKKNPKSKRKNRTRVCNLTKLSKATFPGENADI